MAAAGAKKLYAKALAPNDNSKNQIYLGGDFGALHVLPAGNAVADPSNKTFKAALRLGWLDDSGVAHPAPNAQLILYPQYPEVRLSGFLSGVEKEARPSDVMTSRAPGRVLFLGVRNDGVILAYSSGADTVLARELATLRDLEKVGVFQQVALDGAAGVANRSVLLRELCRIASAGWMDSRRLNRDGISMPCAAPNCGGYTLEAELGIVPNARAAPDFHGWEVKQFGVTTFDRDVATTITLMTPEPSAGYYAEAGVLKFVSRYGYADRRGRENRRNFGGQFRFDRRDARTGLTLTLTGFANGRITDPGGGIRLVDDDGRDAATWLYTDLIDHWKRKHSSAVYVPSMKRTEPRRRYRFSPVVRLATGTTFERLLVAIRDQAIVYDPGIKVVSGPDSTRSKRRSQFRISSARIDQLYTSVERVNACTGG